MKDELDNRLIEVIIGWENRKTCWTIVWIKWSSFDELNGELDNRLDTAIFDWRNCKTGWTTVWMKKWSVKDTVRGVGQPSRWSNPRLNKWFENHLDLVIFVKETVTGWITVLNQKRAAEETERQVGQSSGWSNLLLKYLYNILSNLLDEKVFHERGCKTCWTTARMKESTVVRTWTWMTFWITVWMM